MPRLVSAAVFSMFLFFSLFALAPAGVATAEPKEADLGSGRVVIVPLNLGVRAEADLKDGIEPVWNEILWHFADTDRPVTALERKSAAVAWNQVMEDLKNRREKDVYAAYALFAKRISDQLDYTTIVFPSLVTRTAELKGSTVTWDGVRRHVDVPLVGHETLHALTGPDLVVSREGVRGAIAAASLHVAVLSSRGNLRYEGAGGLTVLQDLVQGEVRGDAQLDVTKRSGAFSDREELREGIATAFKQPLPASRAN